MENVGPDGELKRVQALLTHKNTLDPDCKLFPAQILLVRRLKDALPYITKNVMACNNP